MTARSVSVVTGVIRCTMLFGKGTFSRDPGAKLRVPELCKGGEHLPGHISDAEVDDPGGQPGAVVARCGQEAWAVVAVVLLRVLMLSALLGR